MWYADADLSRRSVMIAMVDDRSRRVRPRRLECRELERIVKFMLDHRPFKVVIEASGSYRWLYDLLAPHGGLARARVAVARKLSEICWKRLRDWHRAHKADETNGAK